MAEEPTVQKNKHGQINDSTIALIAGNLLSGTLSRVPLSHITQRDVEMTVNVARAIAAEVAREVTP